MSRSLVCCFNQEFCYQHEQSHCELVRSCSAGVSRHICDGSEAEPVQEWVHCIWDKRGYSEGGEHYQVNGKVCVCVRERERGREGGRERERKGGRKGGREGRKEEGRREGRKEGEGKVSVISTSLNCLENMLYFPF